MAKLDGGHWMGVMDGLAFWIRPCPLKLKLNVKHSLLMLNICRVNVYFQNSPADLCHNIVDIGLLSFGPPTTV